MMIAHTNTCPKMIAQTNTCPKCGGAVRERYDSGSDVLVQICSSCGWRGARNPDDAEPGRTVPKRIVPLSAGGWQT